MSKWSQTSDLKLFEGVQPWSMDNEHIFYYFDVHVYTR